MIRVVIDTSVLVSAVISSTGPNAQVFELITADKIRPYLTTAVMEEYDRVFEYERLKHLDKRRVANVRRLLEAANFEPYWIFRSSERQRLRTECRTRR